MLKCDSIYALWDILESMYMEELGNVLMLLTIFECISYIMSVDVMVVIILTGKHALTWKNQVI